MGVRRRVKVEGIEKKRRYTRAKLLSEKIEIKEIHLGIMDEEEIEC